MDGEGGCDGLDLQISDPAVVAGVFNAGGNLVGGPNLTIAGRANEQSPVFGGPNAESIDEALSLATPSPVTRFISLRHPMAFSREETRQMSADTRATTTKPPVDSAELEGKVKAMYRAVAEDPDGSYHFELGRELAERLGYPVPVLDQIPVGAVESFAGVGYFFDLAELKQGEQVLDLGSGSGMDVFFAALQVGEGGRVVGVDMTPEQLGKAERLRSEAGFEQVTFTEGHIEDLPFPNASFDVVISNGVINLAPDKRRVFAEAARVLRPGGRLAISDIIAEVELTPQIVADTDLWASCIGGAAQQDAYQHAVETGGLRLELMKKNQYRFLSEQARSASERYGVKSVSALARKPDSPMKG